MKKCCICNKLKPATVEYFHTDRSNKDSLDYSCKECVKLEREKKWAEIKLNEIKHRNGSIKYEVLINVDYLKKIYKEQKGKCYWSNVEMDTTRKNNLTAISIDRLDNSIGYVQGNVVLTTRFMNLGRGRTDKIVFRDFLNKILK